MNKQADDSEVLVGSFHRPQSDTSAFTANYTALLLP
jgi:hypothetical protein